MTIEYDILVAGTPADLAEAVRIHLADRWELLGGVAVSTHIDRWMNEREGCSESETSETWAQAIIRRIDAVNAEHP